MPSSIHQAKRPYAGTHSQHHNQSTITSYFPSTSSGPPTSPHHPSLRSPPQPPPSTPLLPASVQSNLLNVGMRVRKSVPEGYKTGTTFSGFALFSDTTTNSSSTSRSAPPRDLTSPPKSFAAARTELTPFCGIMKVGGLAQQVYPADLPDDDDDVPDSDDVPFLSSQDSLFSDPSTPPPIRHKRRLSSSDSDDAPFSIHAAEQHDGLSPKSQPRGFRQAWDDRVETRMLAQPRSRRAKMRPFQASGGGEGADFEDAEFLDYQALEGGEVVMRDV